MHSNRLLTLLLLLAQTVLGSTSLRQVGTLGLPCVSDRCQDGAMCYHDSPSGPGICSVYVEIGQSCTELGSVCIMPSTCTDGICTLSAKVKGMEGTPCHRGACYDGSKCIATNDQTTSSLCRRL
ncbi:hypothetical protein THRCLA_08594 [Thraustotheca clavata]|uniref:Secreted protein n=1 Tax=Thraustotheca clavata TaxID=74557 RepID=A0A1V9Z4X5_9STRA|nr:hypothetical protein THRCLA_08594 [Thraustotheca clavata]